MDYQDADKKRRISDEPVNVLSTPDSEESNTTSSDMEEIERIIDEIKRENQEENQEKPDMPGENLPEPETEYTEEAGDSPLPEERNEERSKPRKYKYEDDDPDDDDDYYRYSAKSDAGDVVFRILAGILMSLLQLEGKKKLVVLDLPGTIASGKQVMLDEREIAGAEQPTPGQMFMPVNVQLSGDRIYGVGMFSDGSLCAELSPEGTLVSSIPGAVLEDSRIDDMVRRVLNTAALLSLSPDGNRLAVAYSQIAALAFADTQPGLTGRWSKTFFQPSLWFPNEPGVVVGYNKDNTTTFQGLQAFNDKVLALYSGKNRENVEDDDPDHCRHLLVLDWDGKPLKSYELQEQIVSFYADGKDLYGLSYYPEPKIFRFELK